jgi:hypothetical protein
MNKEGRKAGIIRLDKNISFIPAFLININA